MLEHLKPIFEKQVIEPATKTEETKDTIASSVISLSGGQKIIRDNQTGISYDLLFGAYLHGATDFKVIDPYVRLPYQLRNFMELAKLISEKKDPETEVKLHLVTSNNEDYSRLCCGVIILAACPQRQIPCMEVPRKSSNEYIPLHMES